MKNINLVYVIYTSLFFLLISSFYTFSVQAETQRFNNPSVKGYRLDYCKHWGRDCGKPAADLWCVDQGFQSAEAFEILPGIGSQTPTVVFGDGSVCNTADCSGFKYIDCFKPGTVKEEPGRLTIPGKKKPAGAELYKCSGGGCSVTSYDDLELTPGKDRATDLTWNISKIGNATGVIWQVSIEPYPEFKGGKQYDLNPVGLVATGKKKGSNTFFTIDLVAAQAKAKELVPNRSKLILYARVLPIDDSSNIVGQPSNDMKIYYGVKMEVDNTFEFVESEAKTTPGPQYEILEFKYNSFDYIRDWPPGCKEHPRDEGRSGFEAMAYAISQTWNFADEVYESAKVVVITVVDTSTFGVVPTKVWSTALDGVLVSVGIPPDIPDLDSFMNQGVDYFAGELAKQAVSQIPAAELAMTVDEVVVDVALSTAKNMTEEDLRNRLEDEIHKKSKNAILSGANELRNQKQKKKGKYCSGKTIRPHYIVKLRNNSDQTYRNFNLSVYDSEQVFLGSNLDLTLHPRETITIPIMPKPKIRIVQDSQLVSKDEIANHSHWLKNYYETKPTKIVLVGPGDTVCEDPPGPAPYSCREDRQTLYETNSGIVMLNNHKFR